MGNSVKFSWITLYSATDFHESAVTDFYERQDDCGRGQFGHSGSGGSVGGGSGIGGSGKPNYAPPHSDPQGIYIGGVIRRKKFHGGWGSRLAYSPGVPLWDIFWLLFS